MRSGPKPIFLRGVPEDLWQAIRIEALKRQVTVGQLVTAWLRERLEAEKGEERDSGNH